MATARRHGKLPEWIRVQGADEPRWLRELRQQAEVGSEEWCEQWLADGKAAVAEIEAERRAKWERNRRGREQGERAWREAHERRAAAQAAPVELAASAWWSKPGAVWIW
jgi:hypothetical protein